MRSRRTLRICRRGFDQTGLVLLQTSVFSSESHSGCNDWLLFRNFGQRALDVELLVAGERKGGELAGGGEAVNHVADA
jgi:hypothetical protein